SSDVCSSDLRPCLAVTGSSVRGLLKTLPAGPEAGDGVPAGLTQRGVRDRGAQFQRFGVAIEVVSVILGRADEALLGGVVGSSQQAEVDCLLWLAVGGTGDVPAEALQAGRLVRRDFRALAQLEHLVVVEVDYPQRVRGLHEVALLLVAGVDLGAGVERV